MKKLKEFSACLSACVLALTLMSCAAQPKATEQPKAKETEPVASTQQETQAPEVRYEKQTVYLCTGYTTTQHDGSGSRGYEFDYDEYGRATKDALYFDGKLYGYSLYFYDDEAGIARREHYDENGVKDSEGGAKITGPEIDIGGMPEYRHGTYVYNEAGYVIEELGADGRCLYRLEYNEDFTQMTEIGNPDDPETKFLSREATLDAEGNLLTETIYNEDGTVSITSVYHYDDQGRLIQRDYQLHGGFQPVAYPWIYEYDEHGNLIRFDLNYYYGYETVYTYAPYEIWVEVTGE